MTPPSACPTPLPNAVTQRTPSRLSSEKQELIYEMGADVGLALSLSERDGCPAPGAWKLPQMLSRSPSGALTWEDRCFRNQLLMLRR